MQKLEARLAKFGIRPGLERITGICDALGRPQDRLRVILVTGTNGKGSVAAAIASMLTAAGHRTGSYLSPHVLRYNERILIDGKEITDGEFAPYERKLLEMHGNGQEMTLFEALTAIALRHFADQGCEFAVLEIGMGGRLDACNVAMEEAAVITNVELEHTDYLGKSVAEIARDKAHIIKNVNGTVVTGCTGDALREVEKRAAEVGAKLKVLGRDFSVELRGSTLDGTDFDYSGTKPDSKQAIRLRVPLAGKHQAVNAAIAVAVAEALGLDRKEVENGLASVKHPGRLETVCLKPLVVVDGAHNPAGIRALVESMELLPGRPVCVFTALEDKDWRTMLSLLAPRCRMMIINQLADARAAKAGPMAAEAAKYTKAIVVSGIGESVRKAKAEAGENGAVLVCGSLYMIGEASAAAAES
jgi:dihydrofolate synthase/folylpolyglutamate synthase